MKLGHKPQLPVLATLALIAGLLTVVSFPTASNAVNTVTLKIKVTGFAAGEDPQVAVFADNGQEGGFAEYDTTYNGELSFTDVPIPDCDPTHSKNFQIVAQPTAQDLSHALTLLDCSALPSLGTEVASGSVTIALSPSSFVLNPKNVDGSPILISTRVDILQNGMQYPRLPINDTNPDHVLNNAVPRLLRSGPVGIFVNPNLASQSTLQPAYQLVFYPPGSTGIFWHVKVSGTAAAPDYSLYTQELAAVTPVSTKTPSLPDTYDMTNLQTTEFHYLLADLEDNVLNARLLLINNESDLVATPSGDTNNNNAAYGAFRLTNSTTAHLAVVNRDHIEDYKLYSVSVSKNGAISVTRDSDSSTINMEPSDDDYYFYRLSGAYVPPTGYWSGRVLDPTGETPITYAQICLAVHGQGSPQICTTSDSHGNFALNQPSDFSGPFLDATVLSIDASGDSRSNGSTFAQNQYLGAEDILTNAHMTASGNASLDLYVAIPNFNFTIYSDESHTISAGARVQVRVQELNGAEMAKIQTPFTDRDGVAHYRLNQSQLTQITQNGMYVQADPQSAASSSTRSFAQTAVAYSAEEVNAHNTSPNGPLDLASFLFADGTHLLPVNMRFVVTDPTTNVAVSPGEGSGGSYWLTTDVNIMPRLKGGLDPQTENAAIAVPAATPQRPDWVIELFPPGGSSLSIRSYRVVANSLGVVIRVTDLLTGNDLSPVSITDQIPTYNLALAEANVHARVYAPDRTTLDGNAFGLSREENIPTVFAQFGMFTQSLSDGTYHLLAEPGNGSPYASSPPCTVVIERGLIKTATPARPLGCVYDGTFLNFYLTAPNFSITVLDSSGNPLGSADVTVSLQAWNTSGSTSFLGKTSLFIDATEISVKNNHHFDEPGQKLTLQIFPGYGNSSSVGITCQSGDAGTACANLPLINLGDTATVFAMDPLTVRLPAPNTFITVTDPTTHENVGSNAFVQLFKIVEGTPQYLGWSVTGLKGTATFYLSDTAPTTKYTVEVDPPFWDGTYYASNYWDGAVQFSGYTQSELNSLSPSLAIPNVSLSILDAEGGPNAYGWVSAEWADNSGAATGWISGTGFNGSGSNTQYLPPTSTGDKSKIKLTFNPGPASRGVATVCYVTVSSSKIVTAGEGCGTQTGTSLLLISKSLAAGNVTGVVKYRSQPVVGAVVVAKSNLGVVYSVTGSDGSYGLNLDPQYEWLINVNPTSSLIEDPIIPPIGVYVSDWSNSITCNFEWSGE
jgi:hypothetical protein